MQEKGGYCSTPALRLVTGMSVTVKLLSLLVSGVTEAAFQEWHSDGREIT